MSLRKNSVISNIYNYILYSAIIFIAFYLISYCFCYNPHSWYDEGIYLHVSRNIAEYGVFGVKLDNDTFASLDLVTVGYPVFLPVALSIKLFGVGIVQARGVMLVFMALFLIFSFLLVKKNWGKASALASVLLLIFFSPFYGNGRNVLGEVPGMFFMIAGVYFFEVFLKNKNKWKLIISALFFGLAMSTKPTFLIIAPILVFLFFIYLIKKKISYQNTIIFFLTLVLPILFWLQTQFGSTTKIFRVLGHYVNPYSLSDIIHIIISNIGRFFTESTPIHFLLLFVVVALGMAIEFWKNRKLRFTSAFLLLFATLILLSYLRTPGWYRYFFPGHLALIILFPYYLFYLFDFFREKKNIILFRTIVPVLLIALLVLVQSAHLFKNEMSCRKDGVTLAVEYINQNLYSNILFFNVPEILARYNSYDYAQVLRITENIIIGEKQLDNLAKCSYNYVVLPHGNEEYSGISLGCYSIVKELGNYQIWMKTLSYE